MRQALIAIIAFVLGALAMRLMHNCPVPAAVPAAPISTTTVTKIVRDTVIRHPVPSGSTVGALTMHKQAYLCDSGCSLEKSTAIDTIPARDQVHYLDSAYEAWVSGYEPSLDSIRLRQFAEIRVEERTVTQVVERRQSPWQLGISAGYGLTPAGPQPYIGIGITYTINLKRRK